MNRKIVLHWSQIQQRFSGMAEHVTSASKHVDWHPNADVCEQGDKILVCMELAGVDPDKLEVHLEGALLVVMGERPDPYRCCNLKASRFCQMEIEYGPFERTVTLPASVTGREAEAKYVNGFLHIQLHKTATPISKHIEVESGDEYE